MTDHKPPVEEIACYRTGMHTVIRLIAEGEWSAGDMKKLHKQIGHALRRGLYENKIEDSPND